MNLPLFRNFPFALSSTRKKHYKINEFPTFLQRVSTLLEEGYTFAHCIEMLLPYHVKRYEQLQQAIRNTLHDGGGATQVFQIMGLEKQYLVAIELAEMTGQLAESVAIISKQISFEQEMKSKLMKAMSYPVVLFIFLIFLFIAFRSYFLPNMSSMVTSRVNAEVSTSIQWSKFFLHMPDYIIGVIIIVGLLLGGFVLYIRKKRVDLQLGILYKLPLVGVFWRLLLTRQFSRNLGNLLLAGFSLQQALEHLQTQQHQKQIAYVSKVLRERIILGDSLARGVLIGGYFYPKFEHFIAHGESSGLLGRELILYCELLNERLQSSIRMVLAVIQPTMFIIIAVCVIAAYLSILIPMYDVIDFI